MAYRRVAALVGYAKEHGVVKCYALRQPEIEQLVAAISNRRAWI